MSQVRNWIGGVSDGKNSRSARAPMLVNLGKTGIIHIAQRDLGTKNATIGCNKLFVAKMRKT